MVWLGLGRRGIGKARIQQAGEWNSDSHLENRIGIGTGRRGVQHDGTRKMRTARDDHHWMRTASVEAAAGTAAD